MTDDPMSTDGMVQGLEIDLAELEQLEAAVGRVKKVRDHAEEIADKMEEVISTVVKK